MGPRGYVKDLESCVLVWERQLMRNLHIYVEGPLVVGTSKLTIRSP